MTIFDASERYRKEGVPLIVIAGKEYGTGSSRDWAAKGVQLLGVRAVIAENFERIHRSNLIGMGVLRAGVQGRRESADARTDRAGSFLDHRTEGGNQAAPDAEGARRSGRQDERVRGDDARGYARGGRVHPSRRDSAVRAARVDSRVMRTGSRRSIACGWRRRRRSSRCSERRLRRMRASSAPDRCSRRICRRAASASGCALHSSWVLNVLNLSHWDIGAAVFILKSPRRVFHRRHNRRRQHQEPHHQHQRSRITLSHPQSVTDFFARMR